MRFATMFMQLKALLTGYVYMSFFFFFNVTSIVVLDVLYLLHLLNFFTMTRNSILSISVIVQFLVRVIIMSLHKFKLHSKVKFRMNAVCLLGLSGHECCDVCVTIAVCSLSNAFLWSVLPFKFEPNVIIL